MAFSFKTDACESAAITGETSLAGMTMYLDRFYSASVKKKRKRCVGDSGKAGKEGKTRNCH